MMEPGPRVTGITIPDGAWLPPELIFVLPRLTESQLKVLLVVIYNDLQTGGSEPTSLSTLEVMTGLARSSIHGGINYLLDAGWIEKRTVGKSVVYSASVRISDTKLSKKDSRLINNSLTDSLNLTMCPNSGQLNVKTGQMNTKFGQDDYERFGLVSEIRTLGVYFQTAMKLVEEFDEATIRRHIDYYAYALEKRMAGTPGYLVLSLREKWGPPLGYKEKEDLSEYIRR